MKKNDFQPKLSLLDILRSNTGVITVQSKSNNNNNGNQSSSNFNVPIKNELGDRLSAVGREIHMIGPIPENIGLKIKKLYLSTNLLSNLNSVQQFRNVETLAVSNNQIRYYEDILELKSLEKLASLTLKGNHITSLPFYEDYVLFLCPNLSFFDGKMLPNQSIKRQQLYQEAKLNYQKLMNFLSKCIYNEMRNSFISNLVQKRIMHLELIPRVLQDHLRISERTIKQPLATVLRLLRSGEVFSYIIASNEKFFSKAVQVFVFSLHIYLSVIHFL